MKDQILKLRKKGKSYNQIVEILGCSKGTIAYHCGVGQKEKYKKRLKRNRKTKDNILLRKFDRYFRRKVRVYKAGNKQKTDSSIKYILAFKKILKNPVCYLTSRKLNLENGKSYELDHIIPVSKKGKNTLKNMGVTCSEANRAKNDLKVEDFIQLCKEVCEYNGYNVTRSHCT